MSYHDLSKIEECCDVSREKFADAAEVRQKELYLSGLSGTSGCPGQENDRRSDVRVVTISKNNIAI